MADAVHPYDIQIRRTSAAASHEYKVQWFDLDTGQPTVHIWAPRQRLLPAVVKHTLDCIEARAECRQPPRRQAPGAPSSIRPGPCLGEYQILVLKQMLGPTAGERANAGMLLSSPDCHYDIHAEPPMSLTESEYDW